MSVWVAEPNVQYCPGCSGWFDEMMLPLHGPCAERWGEGPVMAVLVGDSFDGGGTVLVVDAEPCPNCRGVLRLADGPCPSCHDLRAVPVDGSVEGSVIMGARQGFGRVVLDEAKGPFLVVYLLGKEGPDA